MQVPIEMQQLGPGVESGIIVEWLKAIGDSVASSDPLVEVETEKTNIEMEALDAGVLAEITHGPGDEVPVGDIIGYLETDTP